MWQDLGTFARPPRPRGREVCGSRGTPAGGWTCPCLESLIIKGFFFPPSFTTEDERDGASTSCPLQAFPKCSADDLGTPLYPHKGFPVLQFPQVVLWLVASA